MFVSKLETSNPDKEYYWSMVARLYGALGLADHIQEIHDQIDYERIPSRTKTNWVLELKQHGSLISGKGGYSMSLEEIADDIKERYGVTELHRAERMLIEGTTKYDPELELFKKQSTGEKLVHHYSCAYGWQKLLEQASRVAEVQKGKPKNTMEQIIYMHGLYGYMVEHLEEHFEGIDFNLPMEEFYQQDFTTYDSQIERCSKSFQAHFL